MSATITKSPTAKSRPKSPTRAKNDSFEELQRILSVPRRIKKPKALAGGSRAKSKGYGELLIDENGNPVIHVTDGEGHHTFAYSDGTVVSFTTNVQ